MNESYSREKFDKAQTEEERKELLEQAQEEAVREDKDFDYSARQKEELGNGMSVGEELGADPTHEGRGELSEDEQTLLRKKFLTPRYSLIDLSDERFHEDLHNLRYSGLDMQHPEVQMAVKDAIKYRLCNGGVQKIHDLIDTFSFEKRLISLEELSGWVDSGITHIADFYNSINVNSLPFRLEFERDNGEKPMDDYLESVQEIFDLSDTFMSPFHERVEGIMKKLQDSIRENREKNK